MKTIKCYVLPNRGMLGEYLMRFGRFSPWRYYWNRIGLGGEVRGIAWRFNLQHYFALLFRKQNIIFLCWDTELLGNEEFLTAVEGEWNASGF